MVLIMIPNSLQVLMVPVGVGVEGQVVVADELWKNRA